MADSTGVEQVKDGKGYVKDIKVIGKNEQTEEGGYLDGVKVGAWKGSEALHGSSFTETYQAGKLISGESNRDGVKYLYTTAAMQTPSFKGGIQKFYEYVGYSLRYPSDALKNNIDGTVIVQYTVEKDGRLVDVEIKKSVYPSLDEEAKRVIRSAPKWIPATLRGVPVRVKYTIPLKFSLPR